VLLTVETCEVVPGKGRHWRSTCTGAGACAVRHRATGRALATATQNLDGARNLFAFASTTGSLRVLDGQLAAFALLPGDLDHEVAGARGAVGGLTRLATWRIR